MRNPLIEAANTWPHQFIDDPDDPGYCGVPMHDEPDGVCWRTADEHTRPNPAVGDSR